MLLHRLLGRISAEDSVSLGLCMFRMLSGLLSTAVDHQKQCVVQTGM